MKPNGLTDLHRHLDGSLRWSTVRELAGRFDLTIPEPLPFVAGMGIDAALARFAFTLQLLQQPDEVRRVAAEICEDAEREGVSALEIRFAPQLHHGAQLEAIVDAALEGFDNRAGLVLCALYGEPPAAVDRLVEVAHTRDGVVGIDLAGAPGADHAWHLADYGPSFQRAASYGLGRTVHAGEGRSANEIRVAVEELGANRIGHGTTLLDDPQVLDLVIERGVVIEACVTSNLHTAAIDEIALHPLPQWLERGVRACVCTDNTLLSAVDAPGEYARVRSLPGMTDSLVEQLTEMGHQAAFVRS